jgi:hypothetical protein
MLITIIVIVGGFLLCALLLIAFAYPGLFTRGWKFLVRAVKRALGRPTFTPEQEKAKAKAKKLAPYMSLANQIEQLIPGQTLRYKIARETWGSDFITVELNPQYPQKGRKYILSTENLVHGMPDGKKTIIYDSDNSIEIATSIHDRNGELFVVAEEIPISAEKKEAENTGKAGTVV